MVVVGTFGAVEITRRFRISLSGAYVNHVSCPLLPTSPELMETLSLKGVGMGYGLLEAE